MLKVNTVKFGVLYNTIQYKGYLVYASHEKIVHWRITESIIYPRITKT